MPVIAQIGEDENGRQSGPYISYNVLLYFRQISPSLVKIATGSGAVGVQVDSAASAQDIYGFIEVRVGAHISTYQLRGMRLLLGNVGYHPAVPATLKPHYSDGCPNYH